MKRTAITFAALFITVWHTPVLGAQPGAEGAILRSAVAGIWAQAARGSSPRRMSVTVHGMNDARAASQWIDRALHSNIQHDGTPQIPLSEVEVRLVRQPAGGCDGPCVNYTVTVHGDGTVEYDGTGPVEGRHSRSVSPDEVVALVNGFLRARFFDALDTYVGCCSSLVRNGDSVALYGRVGGADDPYAALTLRIGARTKTVILRRDFPPDLGRLPELVDRIGGPQVW